MKPRGTILVYHALGECADEAHGLFQPIEEFAEQMELLGRFARVVSLEDIVAGEAVFGQVLALLRRMGHEHYHAVGRHVAVGS